MVSEPAGRENPFRKGETEIRRREWRRPIADGRAREGKTRKPS